MFPILESYVGEIQRKRYEEKPFQQITLNHLIGRFSLSCRLRVEECFFSNPDNFFIRLGHLLSLKISFNKKGDMEKLYGDF
ncbi:hypothetical protein [Chryseobacterium rhizoplanae]|uniref:hypothetical protein n=1 Tax=Chryseobacterium rhizoplanae TaxID=1609531 RepID=UPI003977EA5D